MLPSLRYLIGSLVLLLILGGAVWKWRSGGASELAASPTSREEPTSRETRAPAVTGKVQREATQPWFRTRAQVGIDFRHQTGTSPEKPFPAANGSGIAALDYDLDGLCDLYFATGTPFPLDSQRAEPINRFYRNLGGWRFEEVTAQAGLGHNGYSAGVTVGDFDSDGFPDVYIGCYGANVLYRNMGDGSFAALDASSGALDERWATSVAMFDYDADGLLDIYVCNYGKWTLAENQWCGDQARNVRYYCSPRSVPPEVDTLLHNLGDGTFENATEAVGLAERSGRSQGVVATDLDGDGVIDLYVANDLHANALLLNEGGGRFRDVTEMSGAGYDYQGSMQAGMGVDAEDTNGDGLPELIVTNFENEHNAFYHNAGNGLFQEVSQQRGLYAESLPWVGWGVMFADFDLDGWPDVVVTNGHVDDNRDKVPYAAPPLLWRNDAGRFTFIEAAQSGDYFTQAHVGRALVLADLDNDGDQDLVVGHQDAPPSLLENTRRTRDRLEPRVLMLRLVGTRCNRDAIGSRVTLKARDYSRVLQVKGGGSYLSAHDPRKVVALPSDLASPQLEIRWADGSLSVIDELPAPGAYTVIQPNSADAPTRLISVVEWQ